MKGSDSDCIGSRHAEGLQMNGSLSPISNRSHDRSRSWRINSKANEIDGQRHVGIKNKPHHTTTDPIELAYST